MSAFESTTFDQAHSFHGVPFGNRLPIRSTILDSLHFRSRSNANDPYITAIAADNQAVTLSYSELDDLSNRFACWARTEFGAGQGDVLALLPTNDLPSVVAIYGLLRCECSVLLLSPTDPTERIRLQVKSMGTKAILHGTGVAFDRFSGAIPVPDAMTLPQGPPVTGGVLVEPTSDALLFGTSGSTATSKIVAQSHYNAAVNAQAVRQHHRLKRGDRLLGCLPIHHVNGVHFTLFATLVSGAHAVLASAFDPFAFPKWLDRFRPRIASVVPSIMEALLATWRRPTLPTEFGYFVSAAAPLSVGTTRAISRTMGVRIVQGYGLTETTNFSTTMPPDLSMEAYQRLMEECEIPSIGTAVYGNEVRVLTPEGTIAAPGKVGEICIRGHNVMTRYVGNEAATEEAFRGGWFHSQDLGFEVADEQSGTTFIVITGRSKNIAKVRGETISLDEVERAMGALPYVLDAACVTVPHPLMGEELIAAVVTPMGCEDSVLLNDLATTLSPAALPRRIVRLDAIPRTSTGKIRRAELAERVVAPGDARQ
jgi:acyl-CoA synthetase (AMP-forming)/AMP-acid ligase II